MRPTVVTLTFDNEASAQAFFTWWTNNGHNAWEEPILELQEAFPGFSPSHTIAQGQQSQRIDIPV